MWSCPAEVRSPGPVERRWLGRHSQEGRRREALVLTLAYSPCPNDTFMFHAIASGQVAFPDESLAIELHDVETLNRWAARGRFDITKLSFHAWLLHRERYALLRSGAALGYRCGPLLVAARPLSRADLTRCRVAVPGELTTAHLLLRLWQPAAADRVFLPYDRIQEAVLAGEADCGVLIHEGRFTFESAGLVAVADLGEWWEGRTGLPIPLGCIGIRRELGRERRQRVESLLSESIAHAQADRGAALPYMTEHAAELDVAVLWRHVDTFVNAFSLDLGEQGRAAVVRLEQMARAAGVIQ